MKRSIALSVLLIGTASGACGQGPREAAGAADAKVVAAAPIKVELDSVARQPMPKYLTLTGSILADKQSEIAANVSGRVVTTYVERGQPVKQGEVLALVDAQAANFQAAAASAQSKAAEAQVEQAKQDCARADALYGKGALPKTEYERQKTQCTAQLYSANAARAQADLAGKLAGDTVIRSPINGLIGERNVNVGEYVMPSTKVASVYAIDPVRISISVPEPVVSQVKEGQRLDIQVSAYPERSFPAVVRFVSPTLRPNTRDLIVEAFAENKDHALRPGMFATVLLVVGEEQAATVAAQAIKVDGTVRRLFLAKDGTAHEMVVRIGVQKDGRIAVREALEDGAKVILSPPPGLRDGALIQVAEANK
jgi:membrane fusion protein (multidrug efflux system)